MSHECQTLCGEMVGEVDHPKLECWQRCLLYLCSPEQRLPTAALRREVAVRVSNLNNNATWNVFFGIQTHCGFGANSSAFFKRQHTSGSSSIYETLIGSEVSIRSFWLYPGFPQMLRLPLPVQTLFPLCVNVFVFLLDVQQTSHLFRHFPPQLFI